jgi:hypothetical protein
MRAGEYNPVAGVANERSGDSAYLQPKGKTRGRKKYAVI